MKTPRFCQFYSRSYLHHTLAARLLQITPFRRPGTLTNILNLATLQPFDLKHAAMPPRAKWGESQSRLAAHRTVAATCALVDETD
jgi:hypothetical protein